MSKNAIPIHPQKEQDAYDQVLDDYISLCKKRDDYRTFLIELRDTLIYECSLIGGASVVRDKIDKFLKEHK